MARQREQAAGQWRLAWGAVVCLLALAGCRAPAGRFSAADSASRLPFCSLVFARQIVQDSAVEMTYHPLRGGLTLVAEPAGHLWSVGRGAVGKRLLMPLRGAPAMLQ